MNHYLTSMPSELDAANQQGDLLETAASPLTIRLNDFVNEFDDELLESLTAPTRRSMPGNR